MCFVVGVTEDRSANNTQSIDFRYPVVLFLRHADSGADFSVFPYFHSITATTKLIIMNIML
jgi:hypothetical protein